MKNRDHTTLRKAVTQFDLEGNEVETFASAGVASKVLGVCATIIRECCYGQRESIKKISSTFKYVEDYKEID